MANGLSKGMSIKDIAKKHKVDVDVLKQELKKGIKVEKEHTDNVKRAARIAMDHLVEDPKYYTKLAKVKLEKINLKEYSNKLIKQLIDKFKQEKPNLGVDIIQSYINRFAQIKNSPRVNEKDITKYNWKDLETIVDANQPKRIKAGKLNDGEPKDANLVYNQNGLRIYVGNTKQACIKYGNGYSFCISARGDDNLYSDYRYEQGGTPYFVFDDTKSSKQDANGKFIDPDHLVVVFTFEGDQEPYSTTIADNSETDYWKSFDEMIRYFPRFKGLEDVFKPVDVDQKEYEEFELGEQYSILLYNLNSKYWDKYHKEKDEENAINTYRYFNIEDANRNIEDLLNNKIEIYRLIGIIKSEAIDKYAQKTIRRDINIKTGSDIKDKEKKFIKNDILPDITFSDSKITLEEFLNDWDIEFKKVTLSASWHREYLQDVKKIVDEYRKDLAKIKLMKENLENTSKLNKDLVSEFMKHVMGELKLEKLPKITLSNDSQEAIDLRSWGGYQPSNKSIHIIVAKRHPADIFRTLAHELVHYKQDIEGRLKPDSGATGSDDENEANSKAAIIMRNFAQAKPNLFEHLIKK